MVALIPYNIAATEYEEKKTYMTFYGHLRKTFVVALLPASSFRTLNEEKYSLLVNCKFLARACEINTSDGFDMTIDEGEERNEIS